MDAAVPHRADGCGRAAVGVSVRALARASSCWPPAGIARPCFRGTRAVSQEEEAAELRRRAEGREALVAALEVQICAAEVAADARHTRSCRTGER